MFSSGIYKNRLYKILISTGTIVIVLLAVLSGSYLHLQQKSSYIHNLSNSTAALEANSNIAMNLISRAVNDVSRDKSITKWVNSSSANDFYFNSITALKQLRVITTDSSMLNYELAVTTVGPLEFDGKSYGMVLDQSGTVDRDKFLRHIKGLTKEEMEAMDQHFSASNRPFCLPHYENDRLKSVYYIVKDYRYSSSLLCFVTIPIETLTGSARPGQFLLYSDDRLLAVSHREADMDEIFSNIMNMGMEAADSGIGQQEFFKLGKEYVFPTSLPAIGWEIAYVYDSYMLGSGQIVFFLLILVTAACIFTFLIALLVEALYKPIREVVEDSMDSPEAGKPIDEFKILRQNSEKIKSLSKTLMEAMDENERLASQQQYRRLLFAPQPGGLAECGEEPEEDYSVVVVEFQPVNEGSSPSCIVILKQYVHEFTMNVPDMTFVDLDSTRCAMIVKSGNTDEILLQLYELLRYLTQKPEDETINQWIALSNPRNGLNRIWLAYQETLRILEYKHVYGHTNILTFEQIRSVDAVTYSYPLSMENRMVHCIVEGKEEALQIFDQLIRTNLVDKTLSIESIQSFVYVLIGTLGRVFQELKTSPEALLKEDINFMYLYEHWSDSVTITTLRHAIQDILTAVSCRGENNDEKLLNEMIRYIHTNYTDDIMLNDMADQFNISPKYCGILFKQLSGQNFKDYLNRYRIEKAKELLQKEHGIKIAELSLMVGFNSANSFIRVFGKYTGVTPKAYMESLKSSSIS